MVLTVLMLGLLHRAIQLSLTAAVVTRQAVLNPTWQSMQYLPTDLFEKNFTAALLYLQQTPPLPNLLVGMLCQLSTDPALKTVILIAFAGILSCVAGALLLILLLRMRVWPPAAFVIALLFIGNSDVILLEYTAFGQCFYEQMTMVGCLIAALAAVSLVQHNSVTAAIWLGLAVATLALTRATFSYFVIPVIAWLLWHKMQPKYFLACLLPVALLQGGWAAKQLKVQGHWLWATSTWGGANVQIGDIKRHEDGFNNWQARTDIDCASRWPDILSSPLSIFFSYSLLATGADANRQMATDRGPSPAARSIDLATSEARGKWLAMDSAGFRELSACVQQMYIHYWLHNPDKAIGGWAKSYAQFWLPIDSYTAAFPTVLVASRPATIETSEPSIGTALRRFLTPPHYFSRQEAMTGFIGTGNPRLVPTNVTVIPFAPQLVSLLALAMLHSLPLIAAYIRIKKGSLRDAFPTGFSFLLLLYIYVAGICNLVEYGENMRFRLAVEPVIWSIGIITACTLIARSRRPGLQPGISEGRSSAGRTT